MSDYQCRPTQGTGQFFNRMSPNHSFPRPGVRMKKSIPGGELPGYGGTQAADGLILGGKQTKKKQQKTANWCGKHYSGRGTSHSREDGARGSIPHVPGTTGACHEGPAAARASVPPPNARPPRTPHPSRPASSAKGRRAQTRSWLDGNKRTSGLRLLGVRLRVETDPLRAALPKQCREQLNRFY